jgi:hypothetical protein
MKLLRVLKSLRPGAVAWIVQNCPHRHTHGLRLWFSGLEVQASTAPRHAGGDLGLVLRSAGHEYRSYDPIARVIQIVETITSASSADARRCSGSETRSVERLVLDGGTLSKLV